MNPQPSNIPQFSPPSDRPTAWLPVATLFMVLFLVVLTGFASRSTLLGKLSGREASLAALSGDINQDSKVDVFDLGIFMGHYGKITASDPNNQNLQRSDLKPDGTINIFDLGVLASKYGTRETAAPSPTATGTDLTPTPTTNNGRLSIRVEGNHFVNQNGATIRLLGVNRSGTQYMCYDGGEFFDGPSDNASITAMKSWGINAVRVNLNEHCWLGLSDVPQGYGGAQYQAAIGNYVNRLNAQGLYVIVDMHHSGPGLNSAQDVNIMADRDHATTYWSSVSGYFKNNPAVLFDLYNEPHMGSEDSTATWTCLRDGACAGVGFVTEGMQQMLNAVRATGATNPVLISGPEWAGSLKRWLEFKPQDPANQLVASVHIYGQPLGSPYDDQSRWDPDMLPVAQQVPIVMGEIGDSDCSHKFIDKLMPWADTHGISYFAWGWVVSNCSGEPSLITNYNGTPSNYGIGFRDHLLSLPH